MTMAIWELDRQPILEMHLRKWVTALLPLIWERTLISFGSGHKGEDIAVWYILFVGDGFEYILWRCYSPVEWRRSEMLSVAFIVALVHSIRLPHHLSVGVSIWSDIIVDYALYPFPTMTRLGIQWCVMFILINYLSRLECCKIFVAEISGGGALCQGDTNKRGDSSGEMGDSLHPIDFGSSFKIKDVYPMDLGVCGTNIVILFVRNLNCLCSHSSSDCVWLISGEHRWQIEMVCFFLQSCSYNVGILVFATDFWWPAVVTMGMETSVWGIRTIGEMAATKWETYCHSLISERISS